MIASEKTSFRHAVVRDLAWVMESPGLVASLADDEALVSGRLFSDSLVSGRLVSDQWCQQTYATHLTQLQQLDENPQVLLDFLSTLKSHRLGFYFEALLAFWLEHILKYQPFQKNMPVYQEMAGAGRRTLGEFDFLFAQPQQTRLQHWETTVKFYLCHENEKGTFQWLGPAGQDRLDIKLARIFEHQLRLVETVEAKTALAKFAMQGVNSMALIKGYLFYPPEQKDLPLGGDVFSPSCASLGLSASHLRGWWVRQSERELPKNVADSRWLVLPKRHWLSLAGCEGRSKSLLDDDAMADFCKQHFEKRDTSLLLAEMQCGIGGWREVSRGFVVSNQWGKGKKG